MGNSTRTLRSVVDLAMTVPDLIPVFSVPGSSQQPMISVATKVMKDMLSEPFNWKWNRVIFPLIYTISWQQDYATINTVNVKWLEHAFLLDINNTAFPKPVFPLRVVRDLERTSYQLGNPSNVCWLPNDQLSYAVWGRGSQGDPGPGVVYTNPLGANITPANPFTQIIDPHGNLLVLTTFGTTGATAPDAGANPVIGQQVNDGSCVWQVANPKAVGLRVDPLPPQTGRVWQINVIGQLKPPTFSSLGQLLEPIPDDVASYFEDGFKAYGYEYSRNPTVKARFIGMQQSWKAEIRQAVMEGDREPDQAGIYPATNIMDSVVPMDLGPAYPFRR